MAHLNTRNGNISRPENGSENIVDIYRNLCSNE